MILAGLLSAVTQAFKVPGGLISAWLISVLSVLQALITFSAGWMPDALFGARVMGDPTGGVWV